MPVKTAPLPSREALCELLEYNSSNGALVWKARDAKHFTHVVGKSPGHVAGMWNSNFAGKEAFTAVNKSGYKRGTLWNKNYLAHRIIWKIVHNEEPDDIDHIDGNRLNNRIDNLRNVSRQENLKNIRIRSDNTTGTHGVSMFKRTGKYTARIQYGGKGIHLGYFGTLEEAVAARKAAEVQYGYHENHGRAA